MSSRVSEETTVILRGTTCFTVFAIVSIITKSLVTEQKQVTFGRAPQYVPAVHRADGADGTQRGQRSSVEGNQSMTRTPAPT